MTLKTIQFSCLYLDPSVKTRLPLVPLLFFCSFNLFRNSAKLKTFFFLAVDCASVKVTTKQKNKIAITATLEGAHRGVVVLFREEKLILLDVVLCL